MRVPPPSGPVANRGARIGGRLLDALVSTILIVLVLLVLGDGERPLASIALAWVAVVAYEASFVGALGATPGKLVAGLRVVSLDEVGRPSFAVAAKRGAVDASFTILVVAGWILWLSSTLTDALGRGIADRAAETMVVPKATKLPIAARDLAGYADGARPPRLTALGRVGDLDVRVRARLRRLLDAPLLVVSIGLLAFAASLPYSAGILVLISSGIWVVVFVVDEARRVARTGATAGHRLAGLVIVDVRTAGRPSMRSSSRRALVLALTLYVPPVWLALVPISRLFLIPAGLHLLVSVASMLLIRFRRDGRGLHDLAGATMVVADPTLDPEIQRQRAMRMRIGRAA